MRQYVNQCIAGFRNLSRRIASVETTVLLGVFYFLFVVPTSLLQRFCSPAPDAGWRKWNYRADSLDEVRLQS